MTSPASSAPDSPPESARRPLHVGEIARMVEDQFRVAFPRRLWVTGGVARSRLTSEGDRFFELVEGELALPCLLSEQSAQDVDGTLRRLHDVAVEDLLVEGYLLRAGGLLTYDFANHQLAFSVTALDPQATAARLEEAHAAAAEVAARDGLVSRQRALALPVAPLRVALVGPHSDPALMHARRALEGSGFDVHVPVYDPQVRGDTGVHDLVRAVKRAAWDDPDLVLLLRSPGRPLALAPFDDERVVRALAACPHPVLTGLAGVDDRTVADLVAHEAHPTADAAVDAVLTRLRWAADRLDSAIADVRRAAEGSRQRAWDELDAMRSAVSAAATEARQRAAELTARRRRWVRMVGGASAAVLAVVALVTASPLYLALLGVVVAAVLGEQFGRGLLPSSRRKVASVTEATFTQALERLGRIRGELEATASPEEVVRLEEEAERLAGHGRQILTRRIPPREPVAGWRSWDAPEPSPTEPARPGRTPERPRPDRGGLAGPEGPEGPAGAGAADRSGSAAAPARPAPSAPAGDQAPPTTLLPPAPPATAAAGGPPGVPAAASSPTGPAAATPAGPPAVPAAGAPLAPPAVATDPTTTSPLPVVRPDGPASDLVPEQEGMDSPTEVLRKVDLGRADDPRGGGG